MISSPRPHTLAAVVAAVFPLVWGCADFHRGPPSADAGSQPEDDGGGDGGSSVSFAHDVYPLLTAGCQPCHHSGGAAGGTGFLLTGDVEADYPEVSALTDPSSPSASRLLHKAGGAGHGGGTIYGATTPEYQTLLAWIVGGAQP